MKVAFVFPGQGAQKVGMGREIFESSDTARSILERADAALGESLGKLRDALKGDDAAAIASATESLQQVWHEAAAALYQTSAAGARSQGEAQPGPEDTSDQSAKTEL